MQTKFDVIIAGGGPAGTTAATLLAQYGHRVLLIERGRHPRFHIGESMMPFIEPIMDRLGVDWGEGNLKKGGADFIDEKNQQHVFFSLSGNYGTYQIERSVFDEKLFKNAETNGVETHQQEKVTEVRCHDDKAEVATSQAVYQGRYFIDATGRSALMGRMNKSVNRIRNLGRYALYQHYKLKSSPDVDELFASGNVKILLVDIGWLWAIPLTGNRLSIGLVVQGNPMEMQRDELFKQYIEASPLLTALLKKSEALNSVQTEADFSYVNEKRFGLRYACCGDAAGFLDPVFSSGFFFAVKTAEMIADNVHQGLIGNREDDPELHSELDQAYQSGFKTMHLMIERFYCSNLVNNLIFESDRHLRIKEEIRALLAGDLWKEDNFFQQGLLRGRRRL